MRNIFLLWLLLHSSTTFYAQITTDSIQKIDEVIIESQRMALAFHKQSHTISIVSASEIAQMPVTTLDGLLQHVSGIDIRRRGIKGMQSDLYIRGGNFNQVLLLIDGIPMNDLQTGHHIMNGTLPLENIERIEVIKGAASRIYGQNAMNGAINIITKNWKEDRVDVSINAGSFENFGAELGIQKKIKNTSLQVSIEKQQSEGYRFNTDFDNWNGFLKADWNNYGLMFSYGQRHYGANGFYASPDYKDQYEETQTHLLALKKDIVGDNMNATFKSYWRSNEDMYVFLRHDPDYYKNLHVNDIIGFAADFNFNSSLGNTGVGVDMNQGFIKSNNLGDHKRFSATTFIEHRFQFLSNKLDLTPGVSWSYFSDFKSFVNPGLDIGFRFSEKLKIYTNLGKTSRIPTYTNLYYSSPAEEGNSNLSPEKAFTYEGGIYYSPKNWQLNLAVFNRNTTNLIDWTKENETDKWMAINVREVVTKGFEANNTLTMTLFDYPQKMSLGYTYLDESIKEQAVAFSRYNLNSFRHQFNAQLKTQFWEALEQHISFRHNERLDGDNYQIVDVALALSHNKWNLKLSANNILDEVYTETNLVPMPGANFTTTLNYRF